MSEEPRLGDVLGDLRRHIVGVGIATLLFAIAGGLFTFLQTTLYEARMVIAPVEESQNELDVTLGLFRTTTEDSPLQRLIEVIDSPDVGARLLERHPALMQRLFAGIWDDESQSWKDPYEDQFSFRRAFNQLFGVPAPFRMDGQFVSGYLREYLEISTTEAQIYFEITLEAVNPTLALDMLNAVYTEADTLLSERRAARLERRIGFLRDRLEQIRVSDYRSAMIQLLAEEELDLLTQLQDSIFSSEVLESPRVSVAPVSPRPFLNVLLAGLGGFVIATSFVLLLSAARRGAEPRGAWGEPYARR